MLAPAKHISLVAHTTDLLRKHVASRPPGEKLAAERDLASQLEISRPTLRAALSKLEREGWLRTVPGRGRLVVSRRQRTASSAHIREVALLSPVPLHYLELRVLFWVDALRNRLAKEQHHLEVVCQPKCYKARPEKALQELTTHRRPSAWLLYLSSREMQEWFAASGLPTIVTGSCYESVKLPSVDSDYQATCQHAVRLFAAKGHRCAALLNPTTPAAGDLKSEQSFRTAGAGAGVDVLIARHNGTPAGVCSCLDNLLARPKPPSAFLVARPLHALTAAGHLVHRGLEFPRQVALAGRDADQFLEHAVPSIAHYQVLPLAFANKLTRVVLDFTSGGNPPPREHLIMPNLIPGRTL